MCRCCSRVRLSDGVSRAQRCTASVMRNVMSNRRANGAASKKGRTVRLRRVSVRRQCHNSSVSNNKQRCRPAVGRHTTAPTEHPRGLDPYHAGTYTAHRVFRPSENFSSPFCGRASFVDAGNMAAQQHTPVRPAIQNVTSCSPAGTPGRSTCALRRVQVQPFPHGCRSGPPVRVGRRNQRLHRQRSTTFWLPAQSVALTFTFLSSLSLPFKVYVVLPASSRPETSLPSTST